MLDTGFLQQLVVRLFTLLSSLGLAEAHSPDSTVGFPPAGPVFRKRKELQPPAGKISRGLSICPLSEPFWKVASQDLEILPCALSWLVIFIKVAGQALEQQNELSCPSQF